MILKKQSIKDKKIIVDLTGAEGNAFVLLGYAKLWAKQLQYDDADIKKLLADMKSKNYEHLVEVLDKHFGNYVIFYK